MKKRTAFFGALLSLLPLGQPLFIKTGFFLSTIGIIISHTETVFAESQKFYIDRGKRKQKINDYQGSIDDFTKAIELNPEDGDGYYFRGYSKFKIEDYQGSIIDFTKAIELNPEDGDAYYYRGSSKGNLEDYQGSIDDFTKAININPKDSYAYYYRGKSKGNL